ncbi:SNF2-related protein [Xenorhabdus anantnagensis]|uniref:SNF2-related protein n=1 Tax=Xenorhabdus anantnagensis TaxID=3025875 RepID=A0ABT5LVU3_9GAMM|nr:SNF2-related protein [Xenorhabdus anantnagensis]MDC9597938.1 SNF2-related protein [Xenorhabdus anantnagensis]
MIYSINNGLVELDGHRVKPDILFKLGKFTAEMDGCELTLIVSKRPAELEFEFHLEPSPFFTLYFREIKLDSNQVNSLVQSGYFIADKKRIYFVSDRLREYTFSACGELRLSGLLKLLRQLYGEGLIDAFPSALINQLREKQSKKICHEKLFVRELYPYQKEGVAWLTFCAANGVGTILADDMGLGKTAQVIALCCDVLEHNPTGKILVVVPNPLLANWIREFVFFRSRS